ncbi:MAG: DUF433 domain-containing protein [Deltaproteobacteria bacterium]|nr:DUF433 domain-containing protein [Deltaproteobacteria bacterium]
MDWPRLPPCPYLDFHAEDDVRVRGTRIDLAFLIDEYYKGRSPEEMAWDYPSLQLEAIYGVLTYYVGHKDPVDQYVACQHQACYENYQAYLKQPPNPVIERLRALKAAKKSA